MCIDSVLWDTKYYMSYKVEIWEVFPKYLRNGLEYSDQALQADRYCGGAGAGSPEFMIFRTGAAWERGKVYVFLLSFHIVYFVLALHAAAKRM